MALLGIPRPPLDVAAGTNNIAGREPAGEVGEVGVRAAEAGAPIRASAVLVAVLSGEVEGERDRAAPVVGVAGRGGDRDRVNSLSRSRELPIAIAYLAGASRADLAEHFRRNGRCLR